MPVQDNDDKRTNDQPAVDAEEELRKQKARSQEQQDESGAQKSGKLLPFLNAKAEHHQDRLDTIERKIDTQRGKLDKHNAIVGKLADTAERLEDRNKMLRSTLGGIPIVQKYIQRNEEKIADIRDNKIPKRQQKIQGCHDKIEQLAAKRWKISNKLDRVVALNDAIKSFSIGGGKERRAAFADAMDRLNEATYRCLNDKKNGLAEKKQELIKQYNDPETSIVDKYKIQDKINNLNDRIEKLTERMEKVQLPADFFSKQPDMVVDAQMKLTSDKLADMTDYGVVGLPDLAENTLNAARKTKELDKSQVAALAGQLDKNPLAKLEEQLEDDYGMIDGIINNGSKADIDKAKAELAEGIKNMESLAENPFVPQDMRDNAVEQLVKMKKQLELLSASDEVFVESWLDTMVDRGSAEYTQDGGFKVNPDYYKELPRNDRHVETMTEIQAVEVMSALTAAGVQFSAATKGEDKVGITVSKSDVPALNDVMYASIGKIARTDAARENGGKGEKGKYQTVNPEYYASLSKDQRHTRVEPKDTAREIVKGLIAQNMEDMS